MKANSFTWKCWLHVARKLQVGVITGGPLKKDLTGNKVTALVLPVMEFPDGHHNRKDKVS